MIDQHDPHSTAVTAWIANETSNVARAPLVPLLGTATDILWMRARRTLGDVTLAVIVGRVVRTSAERFPFFATAVMRNDGVTFGRSESTMSDRDEAELREAIAFFLTELLTVVGHLTAEILTPVLHETLSKASVAP